MSIIPKKKVIKIKKEIFALSLLCVLIGAAVWDLIYLHGMAEGLRSDIMLSREYAETGDMISAAEALENALDTWLDAEGYTHIFIRHSEIDGATDAFYELKEALLNGDSGFAGAYDKLIYHIDSIEGMEQFTFGSIF